MSSNYARYSVSATGAVQHWLACSRTDPIREPLEALMPPDSPAFGKQGRWVLNYWAYHPASVALKKSLYDDIGPFTWLAPQEPEEQPVLNAPAGEGMTWRYAVTEEDEMIDFSRFNFASGLMRGWLYAGIVTEQPAMVPIEMRTIGPVQLWRGGEWVYQFDDTFSYVAPMTYRGVLPLHAGRNDIFLHGIMFGWREARLALGLRFPENPELKVEIPLGEVDADQWQQAEAGLSHLLLTRFAFPELPGTIALSEQAPAPLEFEAEVSIPTHGSPWAKFGFLELPSAKTTLALEPGQSGALPLTPEITQAMARLPGENALTLTLRPADGTPLELHREVWVSARTFSTTPYGDYESRRQEARQHLSAMSYDVMAAMAAVETGAREHIDSGAVAIACEFMENRYDCADFYAVSLLVLLYRYGEHPALKPDDRQRIENAFLHFKFWLDEPGIDAMCYFTENHQVLFHVTAYLAGQRWSDAVFHNSGLTGKQQQQRAAERIRNWIARRLRGGYSEWDSNAYLTLDIFAMLAVVEFAGSDRLRQMAETLLNKTFFMIAAQSFRGVHGSSHGRCYVQGLKSARVENSSGLQRIAWGMGIFNGETRATGLLSLAQRYRLPQVLQQIGADVDKTITTRARSRASFRLRFDMRDDEWDVQTVTRRTAHYMLASAVNHRPGEMGVQEHLWQATLSPEAVVFTTAPGNSQEHGNARPNFWSGSVRLPHVAQHGKTLLCLYDLQPDVGLGISHAYFPTPAFDEWTIEGRWAFARYGAGYVALWGDGDLQLTRTGRHAQQEVRSIGAGKAWLCYVGSADEEGSFAEFQRQVTQNSPQAEGPSVAWTAPNGEYLFFAWEAPLRINGEPQPWDNFPHYENAYTQTAMGAERMTIAYEGDALVLDLQQGKTLHSTDEA